MCVVTLWPTELMSNFIHSLAPSPTQHLDMLISGLTLLILTEISNWDKRFGADGWLAKGERENSRTCTLLGILSFVTISVLEPKGNNLVERRPSVIGDELVLSKQRSNVSVPNKNLPKSRYD